MGYSLTHVLFWGGVLWGVVGHSLAHVLFSGWGAVGYSLAHVVASLYSVH